MNDGLRAPDLFHEILDTAEQYGPSSCPLPLLDLLRRWSGGTERTIDGRASTTSRGPLELFSHW